MKTIDWAMGSGNYMGATSFGSFAPVGDDVVPDCEDLRVRKYLAVEIGEVCQLACRHCIYHEDEPRNARPNASVLRDVAATLESRFDPDWVTLAGKEPTMFPEQLVRTAREVYRSHRENILMTNALRLENDLLDQVAEVIDLYDISLDGTEAAHDWMRGQGTFRRTWERINFIRQNHRNRIGIIATAVHSETHPGRAQWLDLGGFGRNNLTDFWNRR